MGPCSRPRSSLRPFAGRTRTSTQTCGSSRSSFPTAADASTVSAEPSEWRPQPAVWEQIKSRSLETPAVVTDRRSQPRGAVESPVRGTCHHPDLVGQGGRAAVLPGSEPALCGCREGPVRHSLAIRSDFVRGASAGRAGEPARVRELPLVLRRRRRSGDGHRLRQRQGLLRHRAGPSGHDARQERDHHVERLPEERRTGDLRTCSRRFPPTGDSW